MYFSVDLSFFLYYNSIQMFGVDVYMSIHAVFITTNCRVTKEEDI